MTGLGIIAGGGDLPLAIADSAREAGRSVFIVALRGSADARIARFPHDWVSLGEAKKIFQLLHDHSCKDVLLCGRVARPRFTEVRTDMKAVLLAPKIIAAARKGDDALLRAVVDVFEREGFNIVGIAEAAPGLLAKEGVLGTVKPSQADEADIALGVRVVRQLGVLDVGQAAAVGDGLVLAVEAAEGTDAMIARIADLPERIRGTPAHPKGVLVKALKPIQDRKTDLPVIGVNTVKNAAAAGLGGIAIEAKSVIIVDLPGVIAAADAARIFVVGFAASDYPD